MKISKLTDYLLYLYLSQAMETWPDITEVLRVLRIAADFGAEFIHYPHIRIAVGREGVVDRKVTVKFANERGVKFKEIWVKPAGWNAI